MKTLSWVVVTTAAPGNLLLGGVKTSESSRWGSPRLARDFLEAELEINAANGRPCTGEVVPTPHPPDIFIHCGGDIQVVGGACPGCGKTLTREDAAQAGAAAAEQEGFMIYEDF